jgi:hypothetical protein
VKTKAMKCYGASGAGGLTTKSQADVDSLSYPFYPQIPQITLITKSFWAAGESADVFTDGLKSA